MNSESAQDILVNDHLRINELFDHYQAERKKDLAKAKAYLDDFSKSLGRHIQCEEKVVFPALEKSQEAKLGDQIAYLLDEHIEIKEAISALETKLNLGELDLDHEEMDIIYRLGEHNAREEYHVYPRLEEFLSPGEKLEVLTRLKPSA